MRIIRTVLGDVPADQAGITLTHEHILYAYPGADLDHRTAFDFDEIAGRIANDLRLGLDRTTSLTLVEMTPAEVYRHPALMRAVAEASGSTSSPSRASSLSRWASPTTGGARRSRRSRTFSSRISQKG